VRNTQSIVRRPETTTGSADAGRGQLSSIPYDLLREASGRLRVLALVVAALWIVGITLDHVFESQTVRGTVGGLIPIADLIAAASVTSSLALYWWAGREGHLPLKFSHSRTGEASAGRLTL
jgi:hypothetical protein